MATSSKAERPDNVRVVRVTPSQVRAAQILLELDQAAGRTPRRSTQVIAEAGRHPVVVRPAGSEEGAGKHRSVASDRPRLA